MANQSARTYTVEQQIECIRKSIQNTDDGFMEDMINKWQQKSKVWEDSPSTFMWSFDSTGCPLGGDKAASYSCSLMYKLVNVPPGRIEKENVRGHDDPRCYTEWFISPDRRSVRAVHHNTNIQPTSSKYLNEVYMFIFEKIPKHDYVFC